MLSQGTRSSGTHSEACALPLNLTEILADFVLGLYSQKNYIFKSLWLPCGEQTIGEQESMKGANQEAH